VRLGFGIEAFRIEAQQQHFIEAGTAAHGLALRLHRPREGLFAIERQIIRFQRRGAGTRGHRDQEITLVRPFSRRIGLRQCQMGRQYEA